ncbi:hypothetical protein LSTR_LSTR010363 [Laodelphax striatellus]|uniref:Uncharacterized protein n=1 Tax=Laodelphax striatellus TaxID=195883 RepID=A0A482WJV4_LAOST|nr:hypothetical protein LSTR_LSTR010363 [Laodelphax striatellus]
MVTLVKERANGDTSFTNEQEWKDMVLKRVGLDKPPEGTKLEKRFARGDPGINRLDRACKQHDIAYSQNSDTASRAKADRDLAERAWSVATSPEAGLAKGLQQ